MPVSPRWSNWTFDFKAMSWLYDIASASISQPSEDYEFSNPAPLPQGARPQLSVSDITTYFERTFGDFLHLIASLSRTERIDLALDDLADFTTQGLLTFGTVVYNQQPGILGYFSSTSSPEWHFENRSHNIEVNYSQQVRSRVDIQKHDTHNNRLNLYFSLRLPSKERNRFRAAYLSQYLSSAQTTTYLIDEIGFSFFGNFSHNDTACHEPAYLFVQPLNIQYVNGLYGISYPLPDTLFCWTSDPQGMNVIPKKDWERYGIPKLHVQIWIGSTWFDTEYPWAERHLCNKNYELNGKQYARDHGYPELKFGDPHDAKMEVVEESEGEGQSCSGSDRKSPDGGIKCAYNNETLEELYVNDNSHLNSQLPSQSVSSFKNTAKGREGTAAAYLGQGGDLNNQRVLEQAQLLVEMLTTMINTAKSSETVVMQSPTTSQTATPETGRRQKLQEISEGQRNDGPSASQNPTSALIRMAHSSQTRDVTFTVPKPTKQETAGQEAIGQARMTKSVHSEPTSFQFSQTVIKTGADTAKKSTEPSKPLQATKATRVTVPSGSTTATFDTKRSQPMREAASVLIPRRHLQTKKTKKLQVINPSRSKTGTTLQKPTRTRSSQLASKTVSRSNKAAKQPETTRGTMNPTRESGIKGSTETLPCMARSSLARATVIALNPQTGPQPMKQEIMNSTGSRTGIVVARKPTPARASGTVNKPAIPLKGTKKGLESRDGAKNRVNTTVKGAFKESSRPLLSANSAKSKFNGQGQASGMEIDEGTVHLDGLDSV
ncbi:hypothetical protein PM082_019701 [Marasmius tenuissimus]|nr:hypothetical protein PM082_019701 [Marasmius tenuissimus]